MQALSPKGGKIQLNTNVCIETDSGKENILLPVIKISVTKEDKYSFNCLLDIGSQRSYFSDLVLKKLNYEKHFHLRI